MGTDSAFVLCAQALQRWLLSPGAAAALQSAYGAGAAEVTQGVQAIMDAVRSFNSPGAGDSIPVGAFSLQLLNLGHSLGGLSHKRACNNPNCSNLSGPSELQLVKGRSSTCSGCRVARYCGKACMKQHWKQHRPVCKALAAAAGAGAAG